MPISKTKFIYQNKPLFVYGLPFLVLIVGLVLSYRFCEVQEQANQQKVLAEFKFDAKRITHDIEQRLNTYRIALRGLQGFFHGSEVVDRKEFAAYVETLALEQYCPGIQGVGLAVLVPHINKEAHLSAIRAEGFPEYNIKPKSTADFYAPIIYMEPFSGSNLKVFGLDIYTIPAARENLIRARDTGSAAISKKLILVQDAESEASAAFVMYLPIYKNYLPHNTLTEKRENILGWIDAPFRMKDFIKGALVQVPTTIDIEIFDGHSPSQQNLLFDLDNKPLNNGRLSATHIINFNDHIWTLTYNYTSKMINFPWLVLISGISLSILSMLLALSLTTGRSRAVTLANQLAKKYKKSERLFRAYFERSRVGMATSSPDKGWMMVNDALCEMMGYSREELLKMTWPEITYPEDLAKDLELFEQLISGKIDSYTLDKRFVHKNGSLIYTQLSVRTIFEDNGKVDFFAALVLDIGQRIKAEEKLRASESRFRDMVNTIDGIVWEADARTFQFTYTSDQVVRMIGYNKEEWKLPGFWVDHLHPEDKDWASAYCASCTGRVENHDFEYRFITKDGQTIWLRDLVTVVAETVDGKEQPKWLRGIMIDVTARKQAEAYQQQLEEQLRQSQKMEALGTLSGGIAHDFNNMLGIILGNAELLEVTLAGNTKADKYIHALITAGQRAANLVQQILTFSRMTPEKLKPTDISEVVKEAVIMLRETISSNIDIRLEIDDVGSPIMANENQLHQIVVNLFTNAVQALDGQKGVIKVHLKSQSEQPDSVCLSVSDTGKGIAKEDLQKIFDPFFTTKKMGEGTGLGLAVLHGIVKSHGGEITVESEPDKGTTFLIYFPVIEEKPEVKAISKKVSSSGKGCILLVEDEQQLQVMYQDFLQGLGYTVICADNGAQALDYFKHNSTLVDLVLTDLAMPELTGKELGKELNELNPDLPIILMTGYSEDQSEAEIENIGIKKCLQKPIALSTLSHVIQELIQG